MDLSVNQSRNKQSSSRKVAGTTVGLAIGLSPFALSAKAKFSDLSDQKIVKMKKKVSYFITEIDSFENIKKYADDIIAKENEKGNKLKLVIITPQNINKVIPNKTKNKLLYKIIRNQQQTMANGLNAFYSMRKKTVNINDKSLYSSVFHEIGHYFYHSSSSTKHLGKLRIINQLSLPFVALGCLFTGILTNKKEHQNNKPQKKSFSQFIHKNAGKIILAWTIPILADEAFASLKGFKLAKNYLTKSQQKLHIKNQFFAFGSYFVGFTLLALAVSFGIFTKDKICTNKKQA